MIDVHLTFSDAHHLPEYLLTIGLWKVSIQTLYIVLFFLIFLGEDIQTILIFLQPSFLQTYLLAKTCPPSRSFQCLLLNSFAIRALAHLKHIPSEIQSTLSAVDSILQTIKPVYLNGP